MSKADTLGPAPAFAAARRSPRRDAINSAIGGDAAATAAITELPVTLISDNPDNPRNHLRNLDETVESVRQVGIILPIVVGTTEAYLRDRAARADDIDDGAQYVVIDGHRRLEASRRVGLATIPVRVDNSRLATDETLLEAAFIANYHRDDMTDLEEAHALKQLVDHYGSQLKAAKRLGIPQATLSTKLSLLKLTPELQKDLVTGARRVEHVRNLGKLTPQEQVEKADARAEAAQSQAAARSASPQPAPYPAPERSAGPAEYHGVIIPDVSKSKPAGADPMPGPAPVPETAPDLHAPAVVLAEQPIPEPRTVQQAEDGGDPAPRTLPYDDGNFVAQHLIRKMPTGAFVKALRVMNEYADSAGLEVPSV
jgi:ParB family chromosome partitioning protein